MTALWIGLGIYFAFAVFALLPAFFLYALGGRSEHWWKVPLWALAWPWMLYRLFKVE